MQATPSIAATSAMSSCDRGFQPVERAHREHQREDEQADAVADDVVAQERRRDDPRRQLPAGDLDRHQQRAEREHEERQRQRDDRLVQRLRAGRPRPLKRQSSQSSSARSSGSVASSMTMAMSGTVHSADLR